MSDLIAEKKGHVAVLRLNRPDRMNAISVEMLTALGLGLTEYDRDTDVRAIVLTGEGRGFCSGLDLKDTAAGSGIGGALDSGGGSHLSTLGIPTLAPHRVHSPGICP